MTDLRGPYFRWMHLYEGLGWCYDHSSPWRVTRTPDGWRWAEPVDDRTLKRGYTTPATIDLPRNSRGTALRTPLGERLIQPEAL